MRSTTKRKEKPKLNKFTKAFFPQQQVQKRFVKQFREFIEVETREDLSSKEGHIVEVYRDNRRFVWCDVYFELPNAESPEGNTILVPVTHRHFVELAWKV